MFWNWNILLTRCLCRPESLLMTFWKFFKKSSKVTQGGAITSLTTYFSFRTFWWVFMAKKIFLWSMLKKKNFLGNLDFFSSKRKNHETPRRATARYTHDFWKILLLKSIYAHRRMWSTSFRATHVIRLATQMPLIKLKKSWFQWYIGHFQTCHMGAPNSFGSKKGRKKNQNFTNCFFQKI